MPFLSVAIVSRNFRGKYAKNVDFVSTKRQRCRAMTTQRRKIKVREYSDDNRPNLKFVVGYREAGKRKRAFFEKEKAAESFADHKNAGRHSKGIEGAEFSTPLRVMAQHAEEQLTATRQND